MTDYTTFIDPLDLILQDFSTDQVHRNVPMTLIGFGFGTPIIPNTSRNSLARTWEASPSSKLYE
ncbi:7918_t:CDS:2 [Entrophospora sp. SA101]|nr:7918_t:CDS:2 [Entrophospora sp. SA101]